MNTGTLQRYRVTVMLPRPAGDDALQPPDAQVLAEATAAAVAAEDLVTAWTAGKTLLSMLIEAECRPEALSAGWAAARALGGGFGASVLAEPVSASLGASVRRLQMPVIVTALPADAMPAIPEPRRRVMLASPIG